MSKFMLLVVVSKEPAGARAKVAYRCMAVKLAKLFTYKCGYCQRGSLGISPRVGEKCAVCGAEVIEVRE